MPKPSKKKQAKSNKQNDRSKRLVELGTKFHLANQVQLAEDCYRKAIEANPMNFRALYLQGILCSQAGSNDKAIEFLKLAIQVNPNYSMAYNDIGVVYQSMGNVKDAMTNYQKALELNKDFHEAKNNLGVAYQAKGEPEKAREYFADAMKMNPYYQDAASNLIFALDLAEDQTVQSLIDVRKKWAETFEKPLLGKQKPHDPTIFDNPKIRIGMVSADFRLHSASFCFGTMLVNYDREKFEVYCYSNLQVKPDERTEIFKQNVTAWRDIFNVPDEAVAAMIRKDKIAILIDLSGFSAGTRLPLFALKPAPIQCCGWGYATSTALSSMDYFLADDVIVPPSERDLYVEKVVYLPNVINYYQHKDVFPDVAPLPALKTGKFTFGSFNRVAKISDSCFRTWAAVLKALPESRFLIKINEADPNATKERIVNILVGHGVNPNQLWFAGKTSLQEHLRTFGDVDAVLDTFVHSGGLSTTDAICQGVPVITYAWPTIVGGPSASMMSAVGHPEFVAKTLDEYVEIAVRAASDLPRLASVRAGLREKFKQSPLGDSVGYCRDVEKLYIKMVEDYKAKFSCKSTFNREILISTLDKLI